MSAIITGRRRRVPPGAIVTTLFLLCAGGGVPAQMPSQSNTFTAMVEAICRQYAAAQTGMPPDLMFKQCMSERRCRASAGPPGYHCEMPGPMTWHGGGY